MDCWYAKEGGEAMELNKINIPEVNLKVCGQSCKEDCMEAAWVGNTSYTSGCWKETHFTPRYAMFF